MPRCRPTGTLAATLAQAEAEMRAEFEAEEEAKRARRAVVARANLAKAHARRARQPQRPAEDARQRGPLLIG